MTKSEKERWEQERGRGYNRYLIRSIVRFGLLFAVLMMLWEIGWPVLKHRPAEPVWELAVKFMFYALFFGVWMGVFTWRARERDYGKPTEDEDAP